MPYPSVLPTSSSSVVHFLFRVVPNALETPLVHRWRHWLAVRPLSSLATGGDEEGQHSSQQNGLERIVVTDDATEAHCYGFKSSEAIKAYI